MLTGRLLDIGCGTGENTILAAQAGAQAYGVDISTRAIAIARAKAVERGVDVTFDVVDVLAPGGPAGQFDVAIDSGVFHVFDDTDRVTYAENLAALVRPGGRAFVLCFSDKTLGDWGPRRVTPAEIVATFADRWVVESVAESGFEVTAAAPVPRVDAILVTLVRRERSAHALHPATLSC